MRTPEAWRRVVVGRLGEGAGEAVRRDELLALPLDFGRSHVFACSIAGDPGLVPELESVTVSDGQLVFSLRLRGRATAVGMIATHAIVAAFDARAASAARVTRALVRGEATTELPVSRED